MQVGIPVA